MLTLFRSKQNGRQLDLGFVEDPKRSMLDYYPLCFHVATRLGLSLHIVSLFANDNHAGITLLNISLVYYFASDWGGR